MTWITRSKRIEHELAADIGIPLDPPTDAEFAAWLREVQLEQDMGTDPRPGYWASYEPAVRRGIHWFVSIRRSEDVNGVEERPLCSKRGTSGGSLRFEKHPTPANVCPRCWLRVTERP